MGELTDYAQMLFAYYVILFISLCVCNYLQQSPLLTSDNIIKSFLLNDSYFNKKSRQNGSKNFYFSRLLMKGISIPDIHYST